MMDADKPVSPCPWCPKGAEREGVILRHGILICPACASKGMHGTVNL